MHAWLKCLSVKNQTENNFFLFIDSISMKKMVHFVLEYFRWIIWYPHDKFHPKVYMYMYFAVFLIFVDFYFFKLIFNWTLFDIEHRKT